MNLSEKKKRLMAIGACAALTLIGVSVAALSLKLGFPKALTKSGFLVSFAGAGGIGVVIALYLNSMPHQKSRHVSCFQKKAWKDLGMYFYSLIIGGVGFYFLIQLDDEISVLSTPVKIAILSAVIALGIWVAVGQIVMKKRILRGLDERERLIYEKAKMISDSIFGGLSMAGFIGIFAWFGPKTPIPAFVPVLMFFTLAFIAEIVKPLVILIQCKMEQAKGGAA